MALSTANYTAFKVDVVLSTPWKKNRIQKRNNICNHKLLAYSFCRSLEKYFSGCLPEGYIHLHPCDIKHNAPHCTCDLQWQISISLSLTFNKCKLWFVPYTEYTISNQKSSLAEHKYQSKKRYLLNFWHLIPKQIPQVTIFYIFAPSISASMFKQRMHEFPCGRGFWSGETPPYRLNFSLGLKYSPHPGGFVRTTEMPTTLEHSKSEKSPCLQHNCWKLSHPLEENKVFLARKSIIRA